MSDEDVFKGLETLDVSESLSVCQGGIRGDDNDSIVEVLACVVLLCCVERVW